MPYTAAVKTARMNAVLAALDAATPAAYIEIGTAGMAAVLATVVLGDPSGVVAGDTLTFSGFPRSDTIDATGTAAAARLRAGDGTDIRTGLTVGTSGSGANLIVGTTSFVSGAQVEIESATLTHG
jgi:hypothetical protein